MFATVSRPRKLTYYRNNVWAIFYACTGLVFLKYKAVCTLCWLHTITIVVVSLVGIREANSLFSFKFQTTMTKDFEICNAENNSICITTDAHETCTLTGDPFKDIAQFGFDLHGCKISFRKKPNKHGHTVTGWFNISGRMESGAGNSYEDIIMYIVERSRAYQVYVSLCHKARKERYWANRVKREAASINV